ncbi:MAG: hypothetical protein JXR11_10855 [Balneola sp.]
MKKCILISTVFLTSFFGTNSVFGQDIGFSAGYGSSTTMYLDIFYFLKNENTFHVGGSIQFADQLGKRVNEQKPNHGRTVLGNGEYFWSLDLSYNLHLKYNFTVAGELSIGAQNSYTNFEDNRFSEGGYHLIDSEITAGVGSNIGYNFSDSVNGFVGFNTLRRLTLGIRYGLKY